MELKKLKKVIYRITLVLSILLGLVGGVINVVRTLMVQILMDGTGNPILLRKLWLIEEGLLENPVSFLVGFVLCFGFTWLLYFAAYWIIKSFVIKEEKEQTIESDSIY
ncbi:MAG: hypothetical protein OXU23_24365 [Candidatus Poribacteria bacterium]|nr:hypothetical protein [Candidatus Poribacteria bacterium]MDE0314374.1 hypothetical protein [Candidatus Poribacteria bacterium]